MINTNEVLRQIDEVIERYNLIVEQTTEGYLDDVQEHQQIEAATAIAETIRRFSPPGSSYRKHLAHAERLLPVGDGIDVHLNLIGTLRALRVAYASGYLTTVVQLVHAEAFKEIITSATYLLGQGYKDAAAMMICGVLEQHLRHLSSKHSLPVNGSDGRPLAGGALNDALAGSTAYDKLEQKQITAILDLRNKAAHGHYGEYDETHVQQALAGVFAFMERFPA